MMVTFLLVLLQHLKISNDIVFVMDIFKIFQSIYFEFKERISVTNMHQVIKIQPFYYCNNLCLRTVYINFGTDVFGSDMLLQICRKYIYIYTVAMPPYSARGFSVCAIFCL